jgi:SAM-dependent methyltransferase
MHSTAYKEKFMDLKELDSIQVKRHPWETSRLKAIQRILRPHLFEGIKVLDVGCGDGYISRNLFYRLKSKGITAVDINFSDERMLEINDLSCGIKYQREMPVEGVYDLILLLDVIEHVEHDQSFLTHLVGKYSPPQGKIMISVPAFQSIYGRHDVFLGHYRRYHLKELEEMITACGLNVISSGFLFFSLLFPKLVLYKLLKTGKGAEGVGNWSSGEGVTKLIERVLNIDNSLLISAGSLGIKIPGLTGWVVCEKRG